MASNLECLGFAFPERSGFENLVGRVVDDAGEFARTPDGVRLLRWYDPSGAGLVLAVKGRALLDLTPTYRGSPGARFGAVRRFGELAEADVLDDAGDPVTRMAVLLEEGPMLTATGTVSGRATVVALGVGMARFAGSEAFAQDDASLLTGVRNPESGEPIRVGAEAFISYALFRGPQDAEPYALLNGVVLAAERRTVTATGQEFIAARIRSAGFEADVCLPGTQPVPDPGDVLAGTAFLVASLRFDPPPARSRRWWRR